MSKTETLIQASGHTKFHYQTSKDSTITRCGISFKNKLVERKELESIFESFDSCGNCKKTF